MVFRLPRDIVGDVSSKRITLRRVYESVDDDSTRFLVDRLWPRGIKNASLRLDAWLKDVAPSTNLCQWFGHDPLKWEEFRRRYFKELEANDASLEPILSAARRGRVTLLYAARDTEHNNAVALKEYLEKRG